MPANAGIQFDFCFKNRLDSGRRRNDGNKRRQLPVEKFGTPSACKLGAFSSCKKVECQMTRIGGIRFFAVWLVFTGFTSLSHAASVEPLYSEIGKLAPEARQKRLE